MPVNAQNESQAALAFSKQSGVFDRLYADNSIVHYKRQRVRSHLMKWVKPRGHILELNAGTGEDAVFFASHGFRVHATDISAGMQQKAAEKLIAQNLSQYVTLEQCSFTALEGLQHKGPYDCIFSNFAGLNCTHELDKVLNSFDALLKRGGVVVLVILPPFCLWESLLFLKGKFKTAFRRFFSKKGRKAHVEGIPFSCWYYPAAYVKNHLHKNFEWLQTEGLCSIVPPSYIEHFAERYPRLFYHLCRAENKYKSKWPWRNIGDYYIISLRKKGE